MSFSQRRGFCFRQRTTNNGGEDATRGVINKQCHNISLMTMLFSNISNDHTIAILSYHVTCATFEVCTGLRRSLVGRSA